MTFLVGMAAKHMEILGETPQQKIHVTTLAQKVNAHMKSNVVYFLC